MIVDIPRFKCYVDSKYLSNGNKEGTVEAYCFSMTLIESRPLFFTVHTEHGAIYSRLPIDAIYHKYNIKENRELFENRESLDQWGAISSNAQAIKHTYLKDYEVYVMPLRMKGIYWCTIDYFGEDFSQDPEQTKTTNVIMLENGQVCGMPNNLCLFQDRHFTNQEDVNFPYKRNAIYFT